MIRLRELRERANMTQRQVAAVINVRNTAVSQYERGDRQLDPDKICALCDLFGCTADYLLGRSDTPAPAITEEDARLIEAYHDADPRDRAFVDHLLRLDLQDTETPAV